MHKRKYLGMMRAQGTWLAPLLLAGVTSCTSPRAPQDGADPVLGWVQGQAIHQSVVDQIAQREGLSSDQALERAADTLRLYFSYTEQPQAQALSPALVHFLRTQSAVRLWLDLDFATAHEAGEVPTAMVDKELAAAKKRSAPFRARLHGLCQIIVRPDPKLDKKNAKDLPGFEAQAREALAPFEKALALALPDLKAGEDCTLFKTWAAGLRRDPPAPLTFKQEAMLIDLAKPSLDEDFVRQVEPVREPALVPPFMTQFGLHLVYVAKVLEPHLPANPDGSLDDQTKTQRAAHMRQLLVEPWRKQSIVELIETLRKTQDIRLHTPPG